MERVTESLEAMYGVPYPLQSADELLKVCFGVQELYILDTFDAVDL